MQLRHVTLPDAAQLAVHVAGGGRPLLLLHAFPLDHRMWEAQASLADRLRLIVPDLRGFGASRDAGAPESIAGLADDMAAVLTVIRKSKSEASASMRGQIATATISAPAATRARLERTADDIAAVGRITQLHFADGAAIDVAVELAPTEG